MQIIIDRDSEMLNLSSSVQIKEKVDSKKTLLNRKNKTSTLEHDNMVTKTKTHEITGVNTFL